MSFKDLFNSIFAYNPPVDYSFELPDESQIQHDLDVDDYMQNKEPLKIYPSLSVNIEYLKTKYNLLINSDVILREFTINARGKQYNSFLLYIDGMVDSTMLDDFVLKPLMLRNKNNTFDGSQNKVVSEAVANNITVRKVKKFDLANYLLSCLMPQNSVEQVSSFDEAIKGVNSRKLCFIYRYFKCCFRYRSKRI